MDFMFEDEVDEVGSDVEAYCPKCKGDTTHVVISKYEDEIRRVQCNPCGDVHSFRKPRGDVEDDVPEPIAAKKRAMMKKLTFEEFFAKHSEKNAKPYEFREHYHENVIVTHPKFGKGFVSEILSGQQGRGDVQGLSARAGSQPQGHAGAAAGRRRRRASRSNTKIGKKLKKDSQGEAKAEAQGGSEGQAKAAAEGAAAAPRPAARQGSGAKAASGGQAGTVGAGRGGRKRAAKVARSKPAKVAKRKK